MHIVYIRERHCYSLVVCTFRKGIKAFKVLVYVQKGALRLEFFFDNVCDVFIQFTFCIPMRCGLGLDDYELYPMDEEVSNDVVIRK